MKNYRLTISGENHIIKKMRKKCKRNRGKVMAAQKKPSVRDVLWRKKHARDQMLDAVGKLCDEAWAIFEKVAADRSSSSNDAVVAREMGLRLRSLAYLIEGEHYIDRIAFELQTKDVYMTASEVARSYVSDIVMTFLDGILLYGKQTEWDNKELQEAYQTSLEQPLEEIRTALIPVPPQQVAESVADD